MKQILFTLLILSAVGFVSCRKNGTEPDIKQYDDQQIRAYMSANGLSGLKRDTIGGDTSGIYYQVLNAGTGDSVKYPDVISYVYTIKTLDNKFTAQDTVVNHYSGFLGHVTPRGLMLAIHDLAKYKGTKIRVIVPSHLGYGVNGAGSGSSTIVNGKIPGNESLDYTIELIDNQVKYDDKVIVDYMAANNLSGYTKIVSGADSGLYYKITTAGTGSTIGANTTLTANYVVKLMNNTIVDDESTTAISFYDLTAGSYIKGFTDGLLMSRSGGGISLLIPSKLGYGQAGSTGGIPANACLRFDVTNITVTP